MSEGAGGEPDMGTSARYEEATPRRKMPVLRRSVQGLCLVVMCVDTGIRMRHKGGTQGGFRGKVMTSVSRPLTTKQTALVDALVANGCSIKEAAGMAGYAKGEAGRVTASKALRLPHVQAYMMQRIGETMGVSATVAASKLVQLATGAKSEYVQLEASKDILDRAGFKAPERHMHLHAGDISVNIDLS